MSGVIQEVRLRSTTEHEGYPPPDPIGSLVRQVPAAVAMAVRMSFRGRSTSRGPHPDWLRCMTDIRFVEASGGAETTVRFEAPRLGEAAEGLYQQLEFWQSKPDATDTGFDLLGDVITDVDRQDRDSERFDPPMLSAIGGFGHVVNGYFGEMLLTGERYNARSPAVVTHTTIATAKEFHDTTPDPVRTRVVGTLDVIRASSDSFDLRLDGGAQVRGVLVAGDRQALRDLWGQRVLVLGTAAFRASGNLLRIDADSVSLAGEEPAIWSRVPQPRQRRVDVASYRQPQGPRSGVAAIIGRWPGDETDEQISAALRELS